MSQQNRSFSDMFKDLFKDIPEKMLNLFQYLALLVAFLGIIYFMMWYLCIINSKMDSLITNNKILQKI